MRHRFGFTMIELVFAIVIIGILAAVAIPRLAATRDDAEVAKGRSDIAAIRSAIVSERQTRLLRGQTTFIDQLHSSNTVMFDGNGSSTLLSYGITPGTADGHWSFPGTVCTGTSPNKVCKYNFNVMKKTVEFTYIQRNGTFDCNRTNATTGDMCKALVD